MKNLVKILLAFLLAFSVTLTFSSTTEAAKKVSYSMNTKKLYTYSYESNHNVTLNGSKSGGVVSWTSLDGGEFAEKETKNGLYDTYGVKLIAYPVKTGKAWKDVENGTSSKITSTTKTVKIKAGTFKKVVVVKESFSGRSYDNKGYNMYYYAPNVGLVLKTYNGEDSNYKTKKSQELIKLKNK